jgi:pimeloyl-ACP methyl ester carboxylesterase
VEPDILRVPVEGGHLHVERYGHGGETFVLLHSFATCTFLWRAIAPEIALRGDTAVCIDLLGYGESDRPYDADYGIAAQAEYIDHAFTSMRIARAAIVGVDLGAAVALRLAATRPDRVKRLVLLNPPELGDYPGDEIGELQRNTARFALKVSQGLLGAAPLITPLLQGSVADPTHMPERLIARYLAPFVGKDGVRHLLMLARSLDEEDLEDLDLSQINAPVTVVWGERDGWIEDGKAAEKLAGTLPHARYVLLPGVGRLSPEEAPERVLELILTVPKAPHGSEGMLPPARREPVA